MDRHDDIMTIERFLALLESYGAAPERWPSDERPAALALLQTSTAARRHRDAAEHLDALLDRSAVPPPSPDLLDRIVTAATTKVPLPAPFDRPPSHDRAPTVRRAGAVRRWRRVAAAASVAAAAIALWVMRPVEPPRSTDATPVDVAMLDVYETPTDALLDAGDVSLVDGDVPTVGCDADDWGCPELEDQQQSQGEFERRIWS